MESIPERETTGPAGRTTLRLESVTVRVGRGAQATDLLHPVSIAFESASMTAIMGASGSGKSSLLQVSAGLRRPSTGRVLFDDSDLSTASEHHLSRIRRDAFGFVFQSYNLLPSLDVYDNVALPLRLRRDRQIRRNVLNALDAVGLSSRARARPSQLSGGQAQRVAIARALAARPRLLFGDEPTGALDRTSADKVVAALRHVVDEGTGVVLVTHDERVARSADRTLELRSGHLLELESGNTVEGGE